MLRKRPDVPRIEGESNWQWCQRYAAQVDRDDLIRALVEELARVHRCPPWSAVGMATGHGSGVSAAIAGRFGFLD